MATITDCTSFHVTSSNGDLWAHAVSGEVLQAEQEIDGEGIDDIRRFDVDEWRNTYNASLSQQESIDILDLGYWLKDGTYIEPTYDWRAEHRNPNSYAAA